MCALFVAQSLRGSTDRIEIPSDLTGSAISWASKIKDSPLYRKSEFRRTLKKYKHCYSKMEEQSNKESYSIQLNYSTSLHSSHRKIEQPLQFMLFGSLGFLRPKEFNFVHDDTNFVMSGDWVAADIGEIHAIAIGYEKGESSIFVETISVKKLS